MSLPFFYLISYQILLNPISFEMGFF